MLDAVDSTAPRLRASQLRHALFAALAGGAFLLLSVASAGAQAQAGSDRIGYNGSVSGDRYSPLTQITAANVAQLHQACTFDSGEQTAFQSAPRSGRCRTSRRGWSSTPFREPSGRAAPAAHSSSGGTPSLIA